MRSRAALLAAALAVVLVPLLVVPMVRAREAAPERPGLDAVCPDVLAGGPSRFVAPATPNDMAGRQEALSQPVPSDGGPATFTLQDSGGRGEPGGAAGSGAGTGTGTGAGSGSGAGTGTGAAGGGAPDGGAPSSGSGPVTGPGRGTDQGDEAQPAPTVPPSEAAAEVTKDDIEDTESAALPWPLLLLLLLVAAAAAAYAMRRKPRDPASTTGEAAAAPRTRRRTGPVDDDLEARVREAFVAGLLDLDRAGLVAYDESLPSSWIARRLAQGRNRRAFGQASATFDEIVYGRRPPSPEDVERIKAGFADIVGASKP
ncbi:MAG TPA: DUF4129 domain-containing protein [Acidimicrobiales bacterium]|nr:DUF4129 domain-containing protein [Acidimicrobiales bacterium]